MKRPNINFIPRPPEYGNEVSESDAGSYWYLITIRNEKKMNKYSGAKMGKLDPYDNDITGYYHGSIVTNKGEYIGDIKKFPYTMEIMFHKDNEAFYYEKIYNESVDAKGSPEYFNAHNGGDKVKNTNDKYLYDFSGNITKSQKNSNYNWDGDVSGSYQESKTLEKYKTTLMSYGDIKKYRRWNTRATKQSHIDNIKHRIDSTGGVSARQAKPVIILEDFDGEGSHLRGSNWHFLTACGSAESITDDTQLRVLIIPKKDWINLVDKEQDTTGLKFRQITKLFNLDNPEQKEIFEPSGNYELVNDLVNSYYADKRSLDHPANLAYLDTKVSHPNTRAAIIRAAKEIISIDAEKVDGKVMNDWKNEPELIEKLNEKRTQVEEDGGVFGTFGSTSNNKRNIMYSVLDDVRTNYGKKYHFVYYITHASMSNQQEWSKHETDIRKFITFFTTHGKFKNGKQIIVDFTQCPHLRSLSPITGNKNESAILEVVLP